MKIQKYIVIFQLDGLFSFVYLLYRGFMDGIKYFFKGNYGKRIVDMENNGKFTR